MRIAVIGSANQGKSTFIDDMIKEWPMYRRSNESYRKAIKEHNLSVNKTSNKHSQGIILDCLIDDIKQTKKEDHVLFDRCPLDNLVYSLWAHDKKNSDIDKDFILESIEKVKESLRALDIIFFTPITHVAPVPLQPRDARDLDPEFISEIDNIFKGITYQQQKGASPFFVKDDAPPIIEIFGNRIERIQMTKLYVNTSGDIVDTSTSVLSPENIDMMESLLREQGLALESENKLKSDKNKIIGAKLGDKLTPKDLFRPTEKGYRQIK
tara:strand:+ start:6200 stop:7000 length:801 start_codon:yes stop_codon:yes gene_type:complete